MSADFMHAFQSEWQKKRRSLASYLVVVGAFFTPAIIIVARLLHHDALRTLYAADDFWALLWKNAWESMAIFFLPMAAILATSLMKMSNRRGGSGAAPEWRRGSNPSAKTGSATVSRLSSAELTLPVSVTASSAMMSVQMPFASLPRSRPTDSLRHHRTRTPLPDPH